jgi:hypothetical protein
MSSYSAGGTLFSSPWSRRVLYQSTHSAVAIQLVDAAPGAFAALDRTADELGFEQRIQSFRHRVIV